ncbi:Wzz/FepE/Etk N-terminal domain-containing protein [Paenibacillus doosanensis]|uniref:Capsular polysaccharide type 8 biosynthesis protein cap8A n=1 Tax=Paenibacillus konkukensis TaxID=2020716 RepID=A0ABY4RPG0_9BACL|nr:MULTISPECIES: Wzz/FepE/Etk N-terminal domain-containing protein [Paenibacillus]MCS7459903.1 Wzz/FepE/Etk N-terminal domain-containing protein [Paenibacillus doosanensis]UQZ84346.1 Capsular polysaccharide type 8 biosynthesis protein cap8A [Paenibacillus konkukensis]
MELDLKDYIKIIKKRIWIIIAIVLVCTVVTGAASYFFIQPVYEASTKLIVNKSNERLGLDQVDINSINLNIRLIDTYKEVIKTPRIMDKVVQDYPEFQLTAEELIKKIKVSSVNNTQVMTVVVQDHSYEKAANIVNAVSKVFQREIPSIMKVDNVSLLNEAQVSEKPVPVKPNPKLNIAISFVVSLMAAVGLAFLLDYLDDSIKTEEDVKEFLELPTLAMIARIEADDLINHKSSTSQQRQAGETTRVTVNQ